MEKIQASKIMEIPKAFQIIPEVWMVPCKINKNKRDFIPILSPLQRSASGTPTNSRHGWKMNEDKVLQGLVELRGPKNWSSVAKELNMQVYNSTPVRKGKQCRERWINHLNPELQKHDWAPEEDEIIRVMQKQIGNKWSAIRKILCGRTENQIKNRWKKLKKEKSALGNNNDLTGQISMEYGLEDENFSSESKYSLENIENLGSMENEIKRLDYEFLKIEPQKDMNSRRASSFNSDSDVGMNLGLELGHYYRASCELEYFDLEAAGINSKNCVDGAYHSFFTEPSAFSWNLGSDKSFVFDLISESEKDRKGVISGKSSLVIDQDVGTKKLF